MSSLFTVSLSREENDLVNQVLAYAGPTSLQTGVLEPDHALDIFNGSDLSPHILGGIWEISDIGSKGFLRREEVGVALRLMGWAQKEPDAVITEALVNKRGPLAVLTGLPPIASRSLHTPSPPLPPPPLSSPPMPSPPPLPEKPWFRPLTAESKAQYLVTFKQAGPCGGILSGTKVWQVLLKSKLPVPTLSSIWDMVDKQGRGDLDIAEFTVAMYLIHGMMDKEFPEVPNYLPLSLWQDAGFDSVDVKGKRPERHVSSLTVNLPERAFTSDFRHYLHQSETNKRLMLQTCTTVPRQLKDISDRYFHILLDPGETRIPGDVVEPFLSWSRVPFEDLACIWDLADYQRRGSLDGEGFALAMFFTYRRMVGLDVPESLLPSFMEGGTKEPSAEDLRREHRRLRTMSVIQPETRQLQAQIADLRASLEARTLENDALRRQSSVEPWHIYADESLLEELSISLQEKDVMASKLRLTMDENEAHRATNGILQAHVQNLQEQLRISRIDSEAMGQLFREDLERETADLRRQVSELRASTVNVPSSGGDAEIQMLINEGLSRENSTLRTQLLQMQDEAVRLKALAAAPPTSPVQQEGSSEDRGILQTKKSKRVLRRQMQDLEQQRSAEEVKLRRLIQELENQASAAQGTLQARIQDLERQRAEAEERMQRAIDDLRQENSSLRNAARVSAAQTSQPEDEVAPPAYEEVTT